LKTKQTSILLLGAKSVDHPLDAIPRELSQLKQLLDEYKRTSNSIAFSVEYEPFFTQGQLKNKLTQLQNQVAILHFAGHSSAEGVLSDDELVYSRHIANHMASWTIPPALTVLNGCHNAGQVKLFHQAGVSVVIATHKAVDDDSAAGFAQAFLIRISLLPLSPYTRKLVLWRYLRRF